MFLYGPYLFGSRNVTTLVRLWKRLIPLFPLATLGARYTSQPDEHHQWEQDSFGCRQWHPARPDCAWPVLATQVFNSTRRHYPVPCCCAHQIHRWAKAWLLRHPLAERWRLSRARACVNTRLYSHDWIHVAEAYIHITDDVLNLLLDCTILHVEKLLSCRRVQFSWLRCLNDGWLHCCFCCPGCILHSTSFQWCFHTGATAQEVNVST